MTAEKTQTEEAEIPAAPQTSNQDSDKEIGVEHNEEAEDPTWYQKRRLSYIMTMIGFSMVFIGSQVVPLLFAALTPLVSVDLNAGNHLIWMIASHLIATGATVPLAGPLADRFGRKPVTLASVGASLLGMILCGATPNLAGYIAGQVFAGMSVGMQEMMAIAAIAEIVPISQRGIYAAMILCGFIPFSPGSSYGQLISESNWRYNALFIGIWNVLTMIIIAAFYFPPPRPLAAGLTKRELLRRIDFTGGFLMAIGISVFLIGLNWGNEYPWSAPRIIATLTLGPIFFVGFLIYEIFLAKWPMFPRRLMQHPRPFVVLIFVIFCAGINYIPLLVFWVIQCVSVYDSTHRETGIRTLPFGFCILGGAIISAFMISFLKGHLRYIMTGFCIMQTIGIACMVVVDEHNINTVWGPLIIGLIGIGGVLVPNQIIITIIVPDDLIATGTALTLCVRTIGQAIGLTLFYNQFHSKITLRAINIIFPAAVRAGIYDIQKITDMVTGLTGMPYSQYVKTMLPEITTKQAFDSLHEAVITAFGGTFPHIYYISIAFGAAACIASIFIGDLTKLMDNHIAVSYFSHF